MRKENDDRAKQRVTEMRKERLFGGSPRVVYETGLPAQHVHDAAP